MPETSHLYLHQNEAQIVFGFSLESHMTRNFEIKALL